MKKSYQSISAVSTSEKWTLALFTYTEWEVLDVYVFPLPRGKTGLMYIVHTHSSFRPIEWMRFFFGIIERNLVLRLMYIGCF